MDLSEFMTRYNGKDINAYIMTDDLIPVYIGTTNSLKNRPVIESSGEELSKYIVTRFSFKNMSIPMNCVDYIEFPECLDADKFQKIHAKILLNENIRTNYIPPRLTKIDGKLVNTIPNSWLLCDLIAVDNVSVKEKVVNAEDMRHLFIAECPIMDVLIYRNWFIK